ncbi:efflux RND transporter permease subunit [Amygdalobacter nucleatus]|uniref:Membrane transport protein MMPL domain-containing protein n=1 Tax=Amygdalobacter nucleatus TaxID=3029274 RepID=A0A133YG98_9FIRM|nr:MMPL family transporter [Amygdalobacter nucleatus]KXB42211.1 hypothetical protein HMPREF1872_00385 [Amygdalobacter nucleatus]MDF0486407.1 MMPL family transporter [Amygdalobacter nucleatus]
MKKVAQTILKHSKLIIAIYVVLAIISVFGMLQVKVQYDLSLYLPPESNSTVGLKYLSNEFHDAIPNLYVATPVKDLKAALAFKEELKTYNGVVSVRYLDDIADISLPLNLQNQTFVSNYYKNGLARYELVVKSENYGTYIAKMRNDFQPRPLYLTGQALDMGSANTAVKSEVSRIMLFAVPFALFVLYLISSSLFEPLLFVLTIFAAVLFNMGSNFFKGDISFITQSIAGIMQLAVSMNYAVFLLHQFKEAINEGKDLLEALELAILRSFSSITSSAVTTFFGFVVLVLMAFRLGLDMGLVLAKGIIFSLICVITLLPCLIKELAPLIKKFSFKPVFRAERFQFLPKIAKAVRYPYLILAILLLPLAFIAQKRTDISYGMGNLPENSQAYKDRAIVEQNFGRSLLYAIIVDREDSAKVPDLVKEIKQLKDVNAVISYSEMVGPDVPKQVLPANLIKQLVAANYERIIVQSKLVPDSHPAFKLARNLRKVCAKHTEHPFYTVGESFSLLDMKDTIERDNIIINYFIIISVALVLLLTFSNFTLPLLIVLTIEFSIWLNLAIPYFQATRLNFIGYLVVNTFQLGATVDYGILLSEKYLRYRKLGSKEDAFKRCISEATASLLAPALILSGCGFILSVISSLQAVSEIGQVLGRGALLSLFNVLILLPNLLYLFDWPIQHSNFNLMTIHTKLKQKLHRKQKGQA